MSPIRGPLGSASDWRDGLPSGGRAQTQSSSTVCPLQPWDVTPICFHQPEGTEHREGYVGGGTTAASVPRHASLPVLCRWGPLAAGRLGNALRLRGPGGDNGSRGHSTFLDAMSNTSRLSVFFKPFLSRYHMPSAVLRARQRGDRAAAWPWRSR